MEREQVNEAPIGIGIATVDTLGVPTGDRPESIGYFALGLSND